jgi:8-oxo-dGTP pyrophosphatase MutT (NUDIX family)
MEFFDLYDKNMNKLGKTMPRGGTNLRGEYFPVVHVWIRRSDGQYLIQQRNKNDDIIPHQWAITGGAVLAGETPLEGAIRETKEELGIRFEDHQFQLLKRYFIDNDCCNYVTYLYLIEEDVLLNDCKLDTVEVKDVAYKSMSEIYDMIAKGTFWNYERMLQRTGYFNLLEKSIL